MKIFVSIHTKKLLVYYKIEKFKNGRAIKRVRYIHWNFDNRVEKSECYVGTTIEIRELKAFMEGIKL